MATIGAFSLQSLALLLGSKYKFEKKIEPFSRNHGRLQPCIVRLPGTVESVRQVSTLEDPVFNHADKYFSLDREVEKNLQQPFQLAGYAL